MSLSQVTFTYEKLSPESLPHEWQSLVVAAKDAAEHAYSPYSRFSVGAAVLTGGMLAEGEAEGAMLTFTDASGAVPPSGWGMEGSLCCSSSPEAGRESFVKAYRLTVTDTTSTIRSRIIYHAFFLILFFAPRQREVFYVFS